MQKGTEGQLDRPVGRTNTGNRNGRKDGREKKTKVKRYHCPHHEGE